MLVAVLGVLFLRAGVVVPGFARVDTQPQILVYAVVFGGSQELLTRLIDKRSNDLLEAATDTQPGHKVSTERRLIDGAVRNDVGHDR
jgi:hypothetical protein